MQDFFIPQATENEIAKEKAKARKLRKTNWWHEKKIKRKANNDIFFISNTLIY